MQSPSAAPAGPENHLHPTYAGVRRWAGSRLLKLGVVVLQHRLHGPNHERWPIKTSAMNTPSG